MAESEAEVGGDHELDGEGQELTVKLSGVVAGLETLCSGRN